MIDWLRAKPDAWVRWGAEETIKTLYPDWNRWWASHPDKLWPAFDVFVCERGLDVIVQLRLSGQTLHQLHNKVDCEHVYVLDHDPAEEQGGGYWPNGTCGDACREAYARKQLPRVHERFVAACPDQRVTTLASFGTLTANIGRNGHPALAFLPTDLLHAFIMREEQYMMKATEAVDTPLNKSRTHAHGLWCMRAMREVDRRYVEGEPPVTWDQGFIPPEKWVRS